VKYRLDAAFLDERKRFALVHTCEHCALFDPEHLACAHGYPIDDHVEASLERPEASLVFCKEFELR
jgi:hypothetical protein